MYLTFVEFGAPINGYFEAKSFQFGNSHGGGYAGGATARAQINDMVFTKDSDSLSSPLFQACATGADLGTVWVEIYKDANSDVYLTYTLSGGVFVTSFTISGDIESVGLNYSSNKIAYFGR